MNDSAHTGRAGRYTLIVIAALLVVVLIGFLWMVVLAPRAMDFAGGAHVALTEYHAQDPTGVPAELKSASRVEQGKYLARAADCEACHTADGGAPFAGGRAFVLPIGTLYSTNITPDKETGIGGYSDADFLNAVHEGIGRNHDQLYPAMPFASYTYMTDADALAIKAYLFSLQPVHAPAPREHDELPVQPTLRSWAVWSMFFNPDQRFEPRSARDPQWNRGAYLVEAMAHCGECHTPRNLLQALNQPRKIRGRGASRLARLQHHLGPQERHRRLERSRSGALSVDGTCGRPGHRDGAHGRGRGQQPSLSDSGRHHGDGVLCALGVRDCDIRSARAQVQVPHPRRYAEGVAANIDSRGRRCMPARARAATIGPGSVRCFRMQR